MIEVRKSGFLRTILIIVVLLVSLCTAGDLPTSVPNRQSNGKAQPVGGVVI